MYLISVKVKATVWCGTSYRLVVGSNCYLKK